MLAYSSTKSSDSFQASYSASALPSASITLFSPGVRFFFLTPVVHSSSLDVPPNTSSILSTSYESNSTSSGPILEGTLSKTEKSPAYFVPSSKIEGGS